MHDENASTVGRLDRFLRRVLLPAVHETVSPLEVAVWHAPGEPVPFADAVHNEFVPLHRGERWGRPWGTTWMRVTGPRPQIVDDPDTRAEIVVDLGFSSPRPGFQAEGLAYTATGRVIKGIAPRSRHIPWPEESTGIEFYIEAASNPDLHGTYPSFLPTRLGSRSTAGDEPLYTLGEVTISRVHVPSWELLQDITLLGGLAQQLPADSSRRNRILRALDMAIDVVDPSDPRVWAQKAREILQPELSKPATASSHAVVATGHAHIDSAWLWPTRETRRKCARTFANALALMDEYDDFVFSASSAQHYQWVQESQPELFARIRDRVAEGRFVPVGGMWVESDTMMPSGESMVRQFLQGKRFFHDELGVDCTEVWLPDSFGYSAALPQIATAAGGRWMLTQKLSWNSTNTMPHHTFDWEGIDGTRIFTHFPPVDTYISELSPRELTHAERNFRDAREATTSLVPFGWGDGGGGPTREMMAAARRAYSVEGLPRVTVDTARAFFTEAEGEYPVRPVWSGEMYLERHRGIFTSQLRTKQGNRRNERLLREAELWASTAAVRRGAEYPHDVLTRCWREVLLLQFHDILPGSSIAWVYEDAERIHREVSGLLEGIIAASLRTLVGEGEVELSADSTPGSPAGRLGEVRRLARSVDLTRSELLPDGAHRLSNGTVSVTVDANGLIISLIDAASGRESVPPGGAANLLVAHRDAPNEWDAWDIDEHYRRLRDEPALASAVELSRNGADLVELTVRRTFRSSEVTERISLAAGARSVELTFDIDWHEQELLLRLYSDIDVHTDRYAAETQFGHHFRPTHANTSWEAARFEACTHRWLHVGEPGFGVAVVNDSSYGHNVRTVSRSDGGRSTIIGTSLLRGPTYPDPHADQGHHRLRIGITPGASIAAAVSEAYRFTTPDRTLVGADTVEPLVTVTSDSVVLETVKLAEDGSGAVIVRLFESLGRRGTAELTAHFDCADATSVDLLERPIPDSPAFGAGRPIDLTIRPFEIVTLRLTPGSTATSSPSWEPVA